MRTTVPVVLVASLVALLAACSSSAKNGGRATSSSSTVAPADACGPPPATPRTALLCNASFNSGDSIGIELHPAATPQVVVVPSVPGLAACPSPSPILFYPGLKACVALDPANGTTLPKTTGGQHVAFVVRAASAAVAHAVVSITYEARDRHFVVRPSARETKLVVEFVPANSGVVGVGVIGPDGGFASPAAVAALTVMQSGQQLTPIPATKELAGEAEQMVRVNVGLAVQAQLDPARAQNDGALLEWD